MARKKVSKKELQKRGRSSRNRGKDYERNCANCLKEVYPKAARLYGQSRKGSDAPDVGGTPFWVECGTGSTIAIRNKLKQALRDSSESEDTRYAGKPALVFVRTANNEHIVSMERSQFMQLLSVVEKAFEIVEGADDGPARKRNQASSEVVRSR